MAVLETLGGAGLRDGDVIFVDASEDIDGIAKSVELVNVPEFQGAADLHTIAARSIHDYLREPCTQMKERRVLVMDGCSLVFTRDFRFTSPSAAAGVLVDRSANGRRSWKDGRGRTLRAPQQARTEATV